MFPHNDHYLHNLIRQGVTFIKDLMVSYRYLSETCPTLSVSNVKNPEHFRFTRMCIFVFNSNHSMCSAETLPATW